MSAAHSALVIGGGIAGPVAATALAMAGIDVDVYEARPSDPAAANGIGGSLALEPNGLAALRIVDADDAVRAAAIPITRSVMSIASKAGREVPTPHGLPPRQLIDRGALHRILRDRADEAGVRIHDGKRLIGVDERPDGVTAHFADGTHASADVLIGADGVHSTVRRLIDPGAPAAGYTGLLGFEGLVGRRRRHRRPGARDDDVRLRQARLLPVLETARRPHRLGRESAVTAIPLAEAGPRHSGRGLAAETARHLRRRHTRGTAGRGTTTSETLQAVGALHIMPPVPHWYRDRMVLVGDSVHAPSNSTGQGASLAMESAIQLARCLRDLPDLASAFAAYERLRRRRVETVAARGAKISRAKAPGPDRAAHDAATAAGHDAHDEHGENLGRRTALHHRLGRACGGRSSRTRMMSIMRVA